jgi:hypothetical protein
MPITEQQTLQEGIDIILKYMEPSKAARFFTMCNISSGDYLDFKDTLFANETAESLYEKVLDFQTENTSKSIN